MATYPGDEKMRELYEARRLSVRGCERELDVSGPTIRAWLRRAGVPVRSISEAKRGQKPPPHVVEASVRARRKHALPGRPVVGYKLRKDGYVDVWCRETQSYVREHRKIAEEMLGRPLEDDETVHHQNRHRADNRKRNLRVLTKKRHAKLHYEERGVDPLTGQFTSRTAPEE